MSLFEPKSWLRHCWFHQNFYHAIPINTTTKFVFSHRHFEQNASRGSKIYGIKFLVSPLWICLFPICFEKISLKIHIYDFVSGAHSLMRICEYSYILLVRPYACTSRLIWVVYIRVLMFAVLHCNQLVELCLTAWDRNTSELQWTELVSPKMIFSIRVL